MSLSIELWLLVCPNLGRKRVFHMATINLRTQDPMVINMFQQ